MFINSLLGSRCKNAQSSKRPQIGTDKFYLDHLRSFYLQAKFKPLLALALHVISALVYVVQVWFLAEILEALLLSKPWSTMGSALLIVFVCVVLRWVLASISDYLSWSHAQFLKHQLRQKAVDAMLDTRSSSSLSTGAWASLMVDQVEQVESYFDKYLISKWAAVFLPVMYALVVLSQDWIAGLLLLFTAPLIIVFMALVGWGAQQVGQRYAQSLGRLSGLFLDRIRGLDTLQRLNQNESQASFLEGRAQDLKEVNLKVLKIAFLSSAVLEFFAALGVAGIAVYIGLTFTGFFTLSSQPMSFHVGLFCLLLAPEVYAPLRQYAALYHEQPLVLVLLKQFHDYFPHFFDNSKSSLDKLGSAHLSLKQEHSDSVLWSLRMVTIQNEYQEDLFHSPVTIDICEGDCVWIAGASGIGKSSLLHALMGLRLFNGELLYKNGSVSSEFLNDHGDEILSVAQTPYIFATTIAENLRFVKPDASDQELLNALSKARLFVSEIELNKILGDFGRGLSAGQLQRLSLARLFLSNQSVILLDEPTAYLNDALAQEIWHEIAAFTREKTLIVVSHEQPQSVVINKIIELSESLK